MNRESAIQSLKGGDPESRRLAVRALGQWSDSESLGAIVDALGDRSRDVQEAASDTLLEVGDARAIRLLLGVLRSDSPSARNFARLVLERLGKADPQLIIELSHDPDTRMRIFCANIIGGICDHDFAPALHHLLEDADVNVRDAAIVALGRLGAVESVGRLAAFLRPEEPWVCFSAIDALSKIPGPEAASALLGVIRSADAGLKEAIVDALGQQQSPSSVAPLIQLLETDPGLRRAVVRVLSGPLGNLVRARGAGPGAPVLAAALAAELEASKFERKAALPLLELLGVTGGAAEVPVLLKALASGVPEVFSAALAVLRRLESVVPAASAAEIRAAVARFSGSGKELA